MSENSADTEQSPFTKPGFIASAAILAVVVLLAVYIFWPGGDEEQPGESPPAAEPSPTAEETEEPETETDSVCDLPGIADAESTLTRGPETEWEFDGAAAYPASEEYGPAEEDDAGFRYCFQQSPEGALFFAANAVGQGESEAATEWIDYAVAPGAHRDSLVSDIGGGNGEDVRLEVIGFRVLSYSPEAAVVELGLNGSTEGETVQLSGRLDLVWDAGDWKFNGDNAEPLSLVPVGQHSGGLIRWREGG